LSRLLSRLGGLLLVALLLLGLMMADRASGSCAGDAVMAGYVTGDSTDDRSLDTSLGLREAGRCAEGEHEQDETETFHVALLGCCG
jgi:hypothetical protein